MIPITKPMMGEPEAEAARRAILSGWTTQGPEVAALEAEFASYTGAPHACAVSNCTAALHLALHALGVRAGDEVITVSHSFIATANSIRYCGATPVFVDVQPDTYNMDPAQIESAITERTAAILCVHQIGMPCDLAGILAIARRHGLPVIEDAACAAGSEILWDGEWQKIGRPHADVACFSFHPRKVISTGDGGMLTTSRPELDQQFRLLRQHGMNLSDVARHNAREVRFENYPQIGFNYRMTDIQAAVGREQLKRLSQIVASRRTIACCYDALLADIDGLGLPAEPSWARSNWQSYAVRLPDGCDQVDVMQRMLDRGVSTRRGVMCCHREEPYRHLASRRPLPASEAAQDNCVLLPLYPQMTPGEMSTVVEALHDSVAAARRPAMADCA